MNYIISQEDAQKQIDDFKEKFGIEDEFLTEEVVSMLPGLEKKCLRHICRGKMEILDGVITINLDEPCGGSEALSLSPPRGKNKMEMDKESGENKKMLRLMSSLSGVPFVKFGNIGAIDLSAIEVAYGFFALV